MNQNNIEENEIYSEEQGSTQISPDRFDPDKTYLVNHDTEEQVENIFDRRQVAIRANKQSEHFKRQNINLALVNFSICRIRKDCK